MIPESVKSWCLEHNYGQIVSTHRVGGGCINQGAVLQTERDYTFFLKTNTNTPGDMFAREADGLNALQSEGGPRVPRPYLWGADFLLMEDLAPAGRRQDYWAEFGICLARLHNCTNDKFGFDKDNYVGSTEQPNTWMSDGHQFFANQRLVFQARLAHRRGLLSQKEVDRVVSLSEKLKEYIPLQPASLIHGDLWSGNAITDRDGGPAIIDPATHYGWGEAELAMTALFGSFPDRFYLAYQEVRPLQRGWRDRFPIYNLYHLLNHLNLFGRSYLSQVTAILTRFAH